MIEQPQATPLPVPVKALAALLDKLSWRVLLVVAVAIVAGISVMSALHVSGNLRVSLRTTHLELTPQRDTTLDFAHFPIRQLRAAGLSAAELNGQELTGVETVTLPAEQAATPSEQVPALQQLPLKAGTRVLFATTPAGEVNISLFERAPRSLLVAHTGSVQLRVQDHDGDDGTSATQTSFSRGNLVLQTHTEPLDLYLVPRGSGACLVCDGLAVDHASFVRPVLRSSHGQLVHQRVSAIEKGTILFSEYALPEHRLRTGDTLALIGLSAELRRLTVDGGALVVELDGNVSQARVGLLDSEENIMPTWLQAARTHARLASVLDAALGPLQYLFQLAGGK
jgi:hypothetical protein